MRSWLTVMLVLALAGAVPAYAEDGSLGSASRGTARIYFHLAPRVNVAPRVSMSRSGGASPGAEGLSFCSNLSQSFGLYAVEGDVFRLISKPSDGPRNCAAITAKAGEKPVRVVLMPL